ncbi:ATP-binding protein [Vibrio clamense]|uniref:ATP-binding protein n=1 Tax=Vibrio clamense TaxID=2910254 RepID=UPI003D19A397
MRRIYLESFFGLILLFFMSLVGYEIVIYQINTDYDYILQEYEAEAYLDTIDTISDGQGKEAALEALHNFTSKTRQILTTISSGSESKEVRDGIAAHVDQRFYYDDERILWFTINNSNDIYTMDVDANAPLIRKIDFDDNIVWIFFIFGFALYCVLLIWFLSRRIRELERVTLAFADGDFNARAPLKGSKKVGTLNQSFNHMADKISGLITSNRALTNAVAHELRTPIFRVQWQAEILSDTNLDKEQQKTIASIIEDTEEMETMVDELLYYARVERPDTDLNLQSISINEWITDQIIRWRKDTKINIKSDLFAVETYLTADSHLLKRALDNLVRNGCKFAQQNIHLVLSKDEGYICIEVHDDGEGVNEKHWPYLFDAFYSADSARNKKKSGHGLGLAIVKQITDRHRGNVSISHSYLGGACFVVKIPNDV